MAWKEGLTQEEYSTDMESAVNAAKKGLFTKEQLDVEISNTKDFFKNHISKEDYEAKVNEYESKINELGGKELSEEEKKLLEKQKELADKEKALLDKENMYNLSEILEENGLPKSLAQHLKYGDKEINEKLVEGLTQIFADVKFNNSFKPNGHKKNDGMTKEQFSKLSYVERVKVFETNPELYKKLSE